MSEPHPVKLYIYDLSNGLAALLSPNLLQKRVEGIWHTSIVVYGEEFFFGGTGISRCIPGETQLRQPLKIEDLGTTEVPQEVFEDYLHSLGQQEFAPGTYKLLSHNCNNFSDELSNFLTGRSIPKYILDLPSEVLGTPWGQSILPFLENLGSSININTRSGDLTQAVKTAQKFNHQGAENIHSRLDMANSNGNGASELVEETAEAAEKPLAQVMEEMEAEEKLEREERKKNREPPIVFKNLVDVRGEFDDLVSIIDSKLTTDEMQSLEELHQYMLEDEGSWALGEGFLNFIGKLLNDGTIPSEARVHLLNVLGAAALKDDVILLLHQDRRDHVLMNYAHDIERLPVPEQESLALVICNLFENISSSEWLLYISEWSYNNQMISNIRATTKVAVNCLLSDVETLQDRGSAIIHNLACKEVKTVVFDDVAVELTMALLQFFNGSPKEEYIFRCMKALARFCQISHQDVPQLIQMIGPPPTKFNGTSARVDEQIALVQKKLK
ncbi:LOW QUALITY PROTEIN: uncharacterized protein [Bemisia tabaci]